MQNIFSALRGNSISRSWIWQQGSIKCLSWKTTSVKRHGSDGRSWEFNRAGFGVTALSAAFTGIAKRALRTTDPDVVSLVDHIC